MSTRQTGSATVIEWSPNSVSWVDSGHALRTGESLKDVELSNREVVIAVSRRTTFIRATRVPNASKADVRRILQVQIGQLFPVPANELAFDFHLTQDVNSEGRLAVIAAIRASDLALLQTQAKSAGLKLARIVPSAFSAPLLAKTLHFDDAAVVHRTAEGLAVDLVVAGELRYSRVAPMPATSLAIEAEISRTFAAAVVSCSPTIAAGALALADADASTDVWSIEMLSGAHLDVNIESSEQIFARERGIQAQRLRLGTVVFAAGAIFLGWQTYRYLDAEKSIATAQSRTNVALAGLKKIHDGEVAKADQKTALRSILDRAFHPGQSMADVISIATNDAPKGIWLTGLSLDRGKALTIRGTALNGSAVSTYQDALVNEQADGASRFHDVKLLFATNTEVEKTPVETFSISAFPVGNLPLIDLTAKKTDQKQ